MTGPTLSAQPARVISGDEDPPRNRGGAIPDVLEACVVGVTPLRQLGPGHVTARIRVDIL